ncbi:MAG: hypothetical protein ACK4N5_14145, partial [Myxococcales bacterium]
SLHLGEVGAGFVGVLLADVLTGGVASLAAVGVGVGVGAATNDGLAAVIFGGLVGAIVFPVLNLAATPVAAVLGARLVDRGHPFHEQRTLGPPLLAAYAVKALEALAFAAALFLLEGTSLGEGPGIAALVVFGLLHYAGVPAAASMGFHAQRVG